MLVPVLAPGRIMTSLDKPTRDQLLRYLHNTDARLEVFDERRQLIRSWGGNLPPTSLAECIRIALELPTIQEYLRVVTVLPTREILRAWDRDGLIDFGGARVYRGERYDTKALPWVTRHDKRLEGRTVTQ